MSPTPSCRPLCLLALALLAGCRGVQPSDTGRSEPPPDESAPITDDSDSPEHTGDSADSADTADSAPPVPPVLPALCINELLAANGFTLELPVSRRPDLVELYNASDVDLSLDGYALTDDLAQPDKHLLGAGLVVPARGHLLLYADGRVEDGPTHLSFSLDNAGGTLGLFTADGWPVDTLSYGAQLADWSVARVADGAARWTAGVLPSPGQPNGPADDTLPADVAGGPVEEAPEAPDLSEEFYDLGAIIQAELVLSYDALRSLQLEPDTWVQGTLTWNGRSYGPVGVRTKGENSWLPITQKASLKLSFDKYVPGGRFLGLEELTFNNMSNDPSMMHERLAYYLYREAGVPAARANHLWLTLNGEPYGLFANVENVDERLLARWFEDPDGSLFEVHDVDFEDDYIDDFTLETGPDDRTNLQGVADAMENSSASRAYALVTDHLSVESFLSYWAVSAVAGQFDAYPYSAPGDDCHVYDDPGTGVLHFLPHGVDETFAFDSNGVDGVSGVLAAQCLEAEVCDELWRLRVWEVQALSEELALYDLARQVQLQISALVEADPGQPYDLDDVAEAQEQVLDFIEGRAAELEEQIGPRP